MTESMCFVGLDVHANQTHAGILDPLSGELRGRRLSGGPLAALPLLERLGVGAVAVYEAGPTGFGLARAASERGLDVRVCAPGLIPRKPADRVRTDARDAERLARLLAAGELSLVRVPTGAEERLRDLVRAREDLRGDLNRARQRPSHFLRRRGVRFEGPGNTWTIRHHRWLRRLEFSDRASEATFADYLSAVDALGQRRSALEAALEELAPQSPWAQTIARLRCFRGLDTLAAVGLCAEIGDFERFAHPRRLGAFLGLVPSERSSDEKRRQGSITKAGPKHSRRLLVEAAKHSWRRPRIADELRARQAGQDPRVVEVAWRARRRLHRQWSRLAIERRKPANVATVARARELTRLSGRPRRSPEPVPDIAPPALPGRARASSGPAGPSTRRARETAMGSRPRRRRPLLERGP